MNEGDFYNYMLLIKAYADNPRESSHGLAFALVQMFNYINEKFKGPQEVQSRLIAVEDLLERVDKKVKAINESLYTTGEIHRPIKKLEREMNAAFTKVGEVFNVHDNVLMRYKNDVDSLVKTYNDGIPILQIFYDRVLKLEVQMAKLTTKARKELPKTDFGMPKQKKYPMPDKAHARNAKARASEMANKGKISKSTEQKIDAKADKKLKKGKSTKKVIVNKKK